MKKQHWWWCFRGCNHFLCHCSLLAPWPSVSSVSPKQDHYRTQLSSTQIPRSHQKPRFDQELLNISEMGRYEKTLVVSLYCTWCLVWWSNIIDDHHGHHDHDHHGHHDHDHHGHHDDHDHDHHGHDDYDCLLRRMEVTRVPGKCDWGEYFGRGTRSTVSYGSLSSSSL